MKSNHGKGYLVSYPGLGSVILDRAVVVQLVCSSNIEEGCVCRCSRDLYMTFELAIGKLDFMSRDRI